MSRRWLVRKELAWARRNAVPLLFVLILLPGGAAYAALGFQHVLPTDTPVAVVPQDGAVTGDDRNIAGAAVTSFSDPIDYDDREAAMRAMEREEVYAVLTVPHGLTDETRGTATFHLYTDGSMVPYREPSRAVATITRISLRGVLDRDVEVQRHERGPALTLSEYLVPTFLMLVTMLLAFTYLPYALVRESRALDRIRVAASVESAVAAKLLTFTVLILVPLGAAQAAAAVLDYRVATLAPGAMVVFPLTFCYLGAFASAVTVLSRFETWGRLVNLAVMLVLFGFTGLVYPVGFFSVVRRQFVRLVPTHYSMIVARGHTLKGLDATGLADMYGILALTTVAGLCALKLAAVHYERGA